MVLKFEELEVLRTAEIVADGIWQRVVQWKPFAREVVGGQLARAVDSIGANIAEAFGRFHFSEKLQFLYYARGSLFETKYWLNRAQERHLMPSAQAQEHISRLTDLARQLNAFAADLKAKRQGSQPQPKTVREAAAEDAPSSAPPTLAPSGLKTMREAAAECWTDWSDDPVMPLFGEEELEWLQAAPNIQYPISTIE